MAIHHRSDRQISLRPTITLIASALFLMGGIQLEVSAQFGGGGGGGGGRAGFGGGGSAGSAQGRGAPAAGGEAVVSDHALITYVPHYESLFSSLQELGPLVAAVEQQAAVGGPNLKKEAEQAFRSGDQSLGLELMFGHMATEYEDAQADLENVRYSKLLRRPVWGIRFGVSMSLRGNGGVDDPQPIREGSSGASRSGRPPGLAGFGGGNRGGNRARGGRRNPRAAAPNMGMGGGPGFGGPGFGGPGANAGGPPGALGGIGGGFGGGASAPRAAARGNTPATPSAIFEREMLNADADAELDGALGLVAEIFADEFVQRFSSGDFGEAFSNIKMPGDEVETLGGEVASDAILADSDLGTALTELSPIPMWRPGLVYIGEGKFDDMLAKAKSAKLDVIFHFDVMVKTARDDSVQNISRCRVIQVSNGNSIGVSKSINSSEAANLASRGTDEREYVEDQFENLFSVIDRDVKVGRLPSLKPEVAQKRLETLLKRASSHSLRTLAEVRMYQSLNLLAQDEVEKAFDIIAGTEGLTMVHGMHSERADAARNWAVKAHAGGE